jgi:hypothetical protein
MAGLLPANSPTPEVKIEVVRKCDPMILSNFHVLILAIRIDGSPLHRGLNLVACTQCTSVEGVGLPGVAHD